MLATATVATPSMAQMAKKVVAPGAKAQKTATMKATDKSKKVSLKGGKDLNVAGKRTMAKDIRSQKKFAGAPVSMRAKAVAKEVADMPTIYGSVIYADGWSEDNAPIGLYKMPTAAGSPSLLFEGPYAQMGGVCIDNEYYATNYTSWWGYIFITVSVYDVNDGTLLREISTEDFQVLAPAGYALDPTTQTVYGITYNADADALQLTKLSFGENDVTCTEVAAMPGNWNSIAFDATGQMYGISYTGETVGTGEDAEFVATGSSLCKIDKQTGAVTTIGETGVAPQYLSSAVIDQSTNRMFWSACPPDETGLMYEVNLQTGAATLLYQFADNAEVVGMYIPAPAAADGAPGECKNVSMHFDGASLVGTATLTTPSTLYDGTTPGSGELFIMVFANGEQIGYAETGWGEECTVDVDLSLMGAGMYDFIVFAAGDGGEGPQTKIKNVWVGADTPEATKATLTYANGNMEVTWNAVTGSVNGGYLDLDNLTYTVKNKDGETVADGLTVTTFSEAVAEPDDITEFFYTVYAVCDGLTSTGAKTNTVSLGAIVPPYTSNFAETGISGWTVIDNNNDGKIWQVYGNEVRMAYNTSLAMDDYLITPAIKLEAGKAYNLTFTSRANSSYYPERIEVKFGTAPTVSGLTETIVEPTDLTSNEPTEFEVMLVPETTGNYYVGFHGISDADQYYLYVGNITIEAGIAATAPGLASDLTVTPDATGALKANIAFNAPSTTMNGETLSSLTKVELLRGNTVITTFDNVAPGQACSYDDTLTEGGNVTYSVIGYNANGKGLVATVSAFIGFDKPAALESATIARTSNVGEVVVSWTPVTEDINGLPLPAGEVTYTICEYNGGWVPFAENVTGESYSYQAVEAGTQDFVQVAVFPVTSAGNGTGAVTDMIPVGTPYDGLSESFPNGTLNYIWGLKAINGGTVKLMDDTSGVESQDGDNGFIGIYSQYIDGGADFFSGMISLDQLVNPGLTFYTYNIVGENGTADINEISVSVKEVGQDEWTEVMAPKTVNEICGETEGWGKVSVSLAAYANKTIQFQITGITQAYLYTIIDNIKVGSILANDLAAASITAPSKVNAGSDYNVDVKVVNEGAQSASGFTVELYADNELAATKEIASLESGASTVVKFDRTMSPIATEDITYYAKVVYAADENETNNQTSSVTVAPKVATVPVVTDLEGTSVNEGVKLTWNEPNLEGGVAEEITQDFEDADAFSAEYGDWTFVDADESPVGGFQGTDVPGITPGATTGSFWIWDADMVGNQTFAAHSGSKYLFALFRYDDGTTDDWAISPELAGDAQTISFYARSYSTNYPEKIEVYYSTSGKEISDFVQTGTTINPVAGDWTLYSYDLPAGAKYFAIRSCATSSFMLMVDDVTFTPAGSSTADLEIAGYNIYRDGVKINDAPVQETSYIDSNVEDGVQYTYVVTVVYTEKGESAASNEVVVTYVASGVNTIGDGALAISAVGNDIVVVNAEGLEVTVATADGKVVYNGLGDVKTVVTVGKGVYVVTAGKSVKKVLVK